MGFIDAILNLAGLLLWLNWRYLRSPQPSKALNRPLLSTLKRVETPRPRRGIYLFWLIALLFGRGIIYWYVGGEVNWTPSLNLIAVAIPFRSDYFLRMVLYSGLSFGVVLGGFYVWLLLLSVVNRKVSDADPFQKMVRDQLGWIEILPFYIKLALPWLFSVILWVLLHLSLGGLGMLPDAKLDALLWKKGCVIGLFSYLAWEPLIAGVLFLYLLNSYVYLGAFHFWTFINATARNLLIPLEALPLQAGRLDLRPVLGILITVGIAEFMSWNQVRDLILNRLW